MKRNSSRTNPKRSLGGFTLVELIVVIAVLAILAGVGAVAYTGYIEYAKKGQDRQLVGELIHAIELADYSDPTLFGESGGAMVVISTEKTDAAGLSEANTAALKTALEDAFGEGGLASTKLSYDKWSGTANMNVFAGLGGDNTQVKTYLDNIKNGAKPTAFAEDMEEYWDIFEGLINGMNDGSILGSDKGINITNMDEIKNTIVDKVVSTYNSEGGNDFTSVINTWKTKDQSFAGGQSGFGFGGRDLQLARNYAFISYAKRQNLTPEMKAELEKFEKEHKFDTMEIITNERNLKASGWADIIDAYYNTQAESDARAYLGLMEAAGQVQKNLKEEKGTGNYTDADFLDALTPYVGMVSNVLTGKTDLSIIKNLATSATGSVVIINVRKKDGVLTCDVSPKPADPREDGASSTVEYTQDNAAFTIGDWSDSSSQTASGSVVLAPGSSCTFKFNNPTGAVDLTGYTYTAPEGITVEINGSNVTVTSTGTAKSGQIVFTKSNFAGSTSVTINVEVK